MAPRAGTLPTQAALLVVWAWLFGGCTAHRPPPRPPAPGPAAEATAPAPVMPAPAQEPKTEAPPPPPASRTPLPLTSPEPHAEPDLAGSVHVVKKGETLYRIAKTYGVDLLDVMEVNDISDPRTIHPGMELFIPGATRPLEVPAATPGAAPEPEPRPAPRLPMPQAGPLRWPLKGVLYRRFGVVRGERHDGIDVAAPEGSPIVAAAAGTVAYAGRQSGYGNIVIVKHEGGLVTLYAHASVLLVKEGERVEAGAPLARVGQSGRTTGPHLHFEVREGTRPRNPLFYLP